ncbi:MAG: squalene synthase HpnD [Calditrichaeota bacterium]|nr:MAG: squalene synthase HpnD [Calditrichota bacterium]
MSTQLDVLSPTVTLRSGSSFLFSFFFLPREKREAIFTLYSFCRLTDDIVDAPAPLEEKVHRLSRWEQELKRSFNRSVSNSFSTIRQIAERFHIPLDYFLELINGMRMDLFQLKYRTFDELKLYCYRVASTVGLMCIQIFGYRDPVIREYAKNLGIALQLTNIIRDVGSDARMGRIYIPSEDLETFGVNEQDLLAQRYSPQFFPLMEYQARRAHRFYQLAEENLPASERRNMMVSEIMKNVYFHLLQTIQEKHYRVLDQVVRVSTPAKLGITLKTVLNNVWR